MIIYTTPQVDKRTILISVERGIVENNSISESKQLSS